MFKYFNYIYKDFYILCILLSVIYFYLKKLNINILISIIIIIIISKYTYDYLNNLSIEREKNEERTQNYIEKSFKDTSVSYYPNKNIINTIVPKNLKYIIQNDNIMNNISNIKFVKIFDKNRFSEVINTLEKIMKIYIFILNDRYNPEDYFSTFLDLKTNVLELLYSFYVVVPKKMNNERTYKIEPYKEIDNAIKNIRDELNKMIKILEKYSKINKNIPYLEDFYYKSYSNNDNDKYLVS